MESTHTDASRRLHSFDNLRAMMMWLGVVIHVAINHSTAPSPLPWRDSQTTPLADLLLLFIHAFRMPVFFILAGYFMALLVAKRGARGMLMHRLRRLALPSVVFWPLLIVCTTVLMLVYVHLMARGTVGLDPSLLAKSKVTSPFNTMHMWFIYYLIWFCVFTAILAPLASRGAGVLTANGSFIPNLSELNHNGLFFVMGLHLYRHQDFLFPLFTARCWRNTAAGCASFVLALAAFKAFLDHPQGLAHIEALIAFLYNLTSWLWSFALLGLALRYLPAQNRVLQYVSDSSYWVFLVHMLGTIGFGALLYSQPFGAVTKIALNILATTAACLLTYQLLVRYTIVGVLLNGQRQPKARSAAVPGVAEPK